MICTIFVPHEAFAKSFTIKLSESLNMSTNDKKPKDTDAKKDTKNKKPIQTPKVIKKEIKKNIKPSKIKNNIRKY